VALRCEDARRRLLADVRDPEAGRHLEDCAACFEALESADPLTEVLRVSRPADAAAPDLTDVVLRRWRPAGSAALPWLTALLALGAAAIAVAVELAAGVQPGGLAGPDVALAALGDAAGGMLTSLETVRTALADTPGLLTVLTAATLGVCVLWVRLTLHVPQRRLVR
jgi:hypothetical protein